MLRRCVLALLLLPLAGCLGGPTTANVGLFDLRGTISDDPTPLRMPDCAVLLEALNQRALDEARAALQQSVEGGYWYGGDVILEDAVMSMDAEMSAPSSMGGAGGMSIVQRTVSHTNNQEALADEGDIVKTDGVWTYVLSNDGSLHILFHASIGDVTETARVVLGNSWGSGHLLLEARDPDDPDDDRLVVVLPGAQPASASSPAVLASVIRDRMASGMTRIVVLDLADRSAPTIAAETFVEGHATGVRLVDGVAHVVVQQYAPGLGLQTWAQLDEASMRQMAFVSGGDSMLTQAMQKDLLREAAIVADAANRERLAGLTLRDHMPLVLSGVGAPASPAPLGEDECRAVLATPGPTGRAVSTILSLDVAGDLDSKTVQVLGASSVVYASGDALVLAAQTAEAWWASADKAVVEATDLHWFDVDGLDVTHRASGRVAGSILDSFALDVHADRLRVASTLNTWSWTSSEPMVSQLTIFAPIAGVLVPTGSVGAIAPTEKIWSVRFTDERAYVVTFRNMDPLWVIDLSDDVPTILGELEIPGVSTYLHPVDDRTLLAIGYGSGPDGLGVDRSSVQVSLFDISDLSKPRRASVLDLAQGNAGSTALHEHKAFTYLPEVGKLAVPLTTWDSYYGRSAAELRLVGVDLARQRLSDAGAVNQSQLPDEEYGPTDIERSFFLGYPPVGPTSLYAVSARGITAHDLATLEPQASVAFPTPQPMYYAID